MAIELAQNVEAPTADMVLRDLGDAPESCDSHTVKAFEGPAQFAHQSSLKQQSASGPHHCGIEAKGSLLKSSCLSTK